MDHQDKMAELRRRGADPKVADNLEVRKEIIRRMELGEITPQQGKAELAAIQREAKRNGQTTLYDPL